MSLIFVMIAVVIVLTYLVGDTALEELEDRGVLKTSRPSSRVDEDA